VIENVDKAAQSEYYLPFEQGTFGRVGGVEVRDKKEPEKGGFLAEVVEIDPYRYIVGCAMSKLHRIEMLTLCAVQPSTTRSLSLQP
jgi:hypothetical protein